MSTTLPRLKDLGRSLALVMEFIDEYEHHPPRPGAADFTYGNPQEMALPGFVDALRNQLEPRDPSWYAYKLSEPRRGSRWRARSANTWASSSPRATSS